jgi:hypothetical protein
MTKIKGDKANRGKVISEREFRAMWDDESLTMAEIGRLLGISETAVAARGKARGLGKRPRLTSHTVKRADHSLFRAMWMANVIMRDMRARFGLSHTGVAETARRLGCPERQASRWNVISIAQFAEMQLAQRMERRAKAEREMLKLSEMVDVIQNRKAA